MKLIEQNPKKSLNKAYLKEKVGREDIENFKAHLKNLLTNLNEKESEENAKNKLTKFLYDSFYNGKNEINTKGRIDLAIYEENTPTVIIECKKPEEKYDLISKENPSAKAMYELILYYLRERVEHKNINTKYLIATDIYQWFIFDEFYFDKYIFRNKKLVKDYEAWKISGKDTKFFYLNIAAPFVKELGEEVPFTYFNLKDYSKTTSKNDQTEDGKLLPIYKILSPAHLLKEPFANDSNFLNKGFYNELLHLIGLEEIKKDGKKLIQRKPEETRDEGSLLENTIAILEQEDCLRKLKNPQNFGDTQDEKLYSVALELCITWVNRVLFLKLLEAQLLNYHRADSNYKFLDIKHIQDYDGLNKLFFSVLAKKQVERKGSIKEKFSRIPYLNSSLFEISSLEHATIKISSLDNSTPLQTHSDTVLKDGKGKRKSEQINPLQYFFEFLDAYDFTSEGTEAIQEDNKTLINASVLGLIFEKINGYKDGSFFTPGFITMYMCRESIRKVVLGKFNDFYGWNCIDFSALKDKIEDKKKANDLINDIKICDPAVGSGHFLVSALNEMIAIKSDLKILCYRDGSRVKDYKIKIENDELIIIDEDEDEIFEYKMGKSGKPITELQDLQEAIFHEKETIIENCLFGVDLNPNSVKICRLRLWIELLKHSYYTKRSEYTELETLPNIDINIKKGNSLISRFDLEDNIQTALKNVKVKDKAATTKDYLDAVNGYKTTNNKDEKEKVFDIINSIKEAFQGTITETFKAKSAKARGAITKLETEINSKQQWGEKIPKSMLDDLAKAKIKFAKIEKEKEGILTSAIYRNAFEWRFEFPEIWDKDGNYVGFDLIIGNPPWGADVPEDTLKIIKEENNDIIVRMTDTFMFFLNKSFSIKNEKGLIAMIIPDVLLYQVDNQKLRLKILDNFQLDLALNLGDNIFTDVARPSAIVIIDSMITNQTRISNFRVKEGITIDKIKVADLKTDTYRHLPYNIFATENLEGYALLTKAGNNKLSDYIDEDGIQRGVSPDLKEAFIVDKEIVKANNLEKAVIKNTVTGGVDVKKYYIPKSDKLLIYTDSSTEAKDIPNIIKFISQYKKKITCKEVQQGKHAFYCLHRARSKSIFTKKEKVVGVITGDRIITALDNNQLYPTDGLYLFSCNEKTTNKSLIAILNSKLITYFYRLYSLEAGRTLAQIKPSILQDIPIKQPSKETQKLLETKVDEIATKKKVDINADVSSIEKEIDVLVYKLYNLSTDEIKIIES